MEARETTLDQKLQELMSIVLKQQEKIDKLIEEADEKKVSSLPVF